ncbi:MAG TPA: DUF1800 domain-containing protein [Vicinamibacterales bacterium]|jgi:uncharacterized protein (DUF1800 family)|nr:DUF1800 domain-containing protein [Vicinamibacterales bacterium]
MVSTGGAAADSDRAIVHVLNRIGFGPRPGDVEKVRTMGLDRYLELQRHPDRISDAAMIARLSELTTIGMSSREIAGKFALPALEAQRERKRNAKDDSPQTPRRKDPEQERASRVMLELSEQKMLRAIYSERQLQEVLTDFWFNHFNVDARKGPDRFMLTEYERETIRPHVLGKFRDLLEATAKSPAMLFYLDNWMSASPNGPDISSREMTMNRRGIARVRPQQQGTNAPRSGALGVPAERVRGAGAPGVNKGLNENYGRELMELHTLGVDGGYTQKDVTEVARAFTGWTIENPRQGGGFMFNPRLHDTGEKVVLGHRLKSGGGISDGEQVLDILARHPSTARFIATKLARRFVSDTPPASLVDRAAARFRDTNGDLREVTRTILTSPEFLSPDAYRAKIKTPLEFVASAVRATSAEVRDASLLVRTMQQLGMPLYQCQPPTGYKDTADAWVNTGALVNRMNFAVSLTNNQLRGVSVTTALVGDDPQPVPRSLVGDDLSDSTRATIAKATTPQQMAALTLGSPEFQRR